MILPEGSFDCIKNDADPLYLLHPGQAKCDKERREKDDSNSENLPDFQHLDSPAHHPLNGFLRDSAQYELSRLVIAHNFYNKIKLSMVNILSHLNLPLLACGLFYLDPSLVVLIL